MTQTAQTSQLKREEIQNLVAAGVEASESGHWAAAADLFLQTFTLSRQPHHATRYISALLKADQGKAALKACDTLPVLETEEAIAKRADQKMRAMVATGDLEAAQDYLAIIAPGTYKVSFLMSLVRSLQSIGLAVNADILRPHFQAVGDESEICVFELSLGLATGDERIALALYDRLVALGVEPHAGAARVQRARIIAKQGDRAAAAVAWGRVLKHDPGHVEATRFSINDAVQQGQLGRAQMLLDQVKHALSDADIVLLQALTLRDGWEVVELLQSAVDRSPDNFDLRMALVETLLRLRDLPRSRETLEAALQANPEDIAVNKAFIKWLGLSDAPLKTQLRQAKKTLALDLVDHDSQQMVGVLLTRMGRRADALRHFLSAIETPGAPATLWRKAAELLVEESCFEDAIALAERAQSELGSDTPQKLVDDAHIYFAARQAKDAMRLIERALTAQPDFAPALRLASEVELNQGRDAAAARFLERLDDQAPAKRRSFLADNMARCTAAAMYPRGPGDEDAPHNLFPERMFHHVARSALIDRDPARQGILHVGATLAAGGAERQLSYALDTLRRSGNPARRPQLALRGIAAEKGNDFYLEDVKATGAEVTVLKDLVTSGAARRFLAHRTDCGQILRGFSAMSAEVSDVTLPLLAFFLKTRPKIVHLWQDSICVSGGLAAMAAGVPGIVLSLRSTTPVEVQRSRRHLREGFLACTEYRGAVRLINNSAAGARDYEGWLELEEDRVGVIWNGYDFDRIAARAATKAPMDIRAEIGVPQDALLIGNVIRFASEKRPELWIDTVAEAIAHDDRIYGLLVGDGPKWQSLFEMVKRRGLSDRIKMVGRQSPVEPWMAAMDLFFLSSYREGLPNVLIEAQALGIPVATMNVGGTAETLPGPEASLLLPEVPPAELAKMLLKAVGDADWRKAAGQRAQAFVHGQFSLEATGSALMRLYDDMDAEIETLRENNKP
jgi:glycosyltransferase involved in cell wall biosynthesis/tetratricopeptide (TPR) repeat protein